MRKNVPTFGISALVIGYSFIRLFLLHPAGSAGVFAVQKGSLGLESKVMNLYTVAFIKKKPLNL